MRFLGLLVVLAIIYYAVSKRAESGSKGTDEAMDEFARTAPASTTASPAAASPARAAASPSPPSPATSNLRRPLDTTRNVLEKVKQRNGDGDF